MKRTIARCCAECGVSFKAARPTAEFCSAVCRKRHDNRRAMRGAQLYDWFMPHRFEREAAKDAGALQAMNRLASIWREEDRRERAGRRSWQRLAKTRSEASWLRAVRLR